MATVAPSSDQAADLLQKLSLDSQTKTLEIPEPTKKPCVDSGDATNGQIQSFDRSVTPLLQDIIDPSMCYLPGGYASTAYYYGGYEGNGNEWDEYSRYVTADGVEIPTGVYGENGSLMYHHGYGYASYSPYSPAGSPVPTVGHDGQLYGAHQHYQYPAPYFQQPPPPPTPTNGLYPPTTQAVPAPPKGEITTTSTATGAGQAPSLSVDTGNSNGISSSTAGGGGALKGNNNGNVSAPVVRSTYQSSSFNTNNGASYGRAVALPPPAAAGYQDPRFNNNNNNHDGIRSPIPWMDGPLYSSDGYHHPRNLSSSITSSSISNNNNNNGNSVPTSRSQHLRPPHSQLMGMHHPRPTTGMNTANLYTSRMYPNKLYGGHQYGNNNNFRSGLVYGSNNAYDSRTNGGGQGWLTVDNNSKFKPRGGRGGNNNGFFGYYGNSENADGLNELNRGPRAKSSSSKNQKGNFTPIAIVVKGQNIPLNDDKDDNNKVTTTVIPDRDQYNRPDFPDNYADAKFFIIKSYSEDDVHKSIKYNVWASTQNGNKKLDAAYQEAQQKAGACPVFLFFSVNTSGQFVGVAEMVGPVDFNKSVEYWQQDKWIGCFPVKWHIVKDVPNTLLKHITLENNENKPVTNSRDTQEVKLEEGLQLLKIFKDHSSKQCILDDFYFYEDRQKRIQEKKSKQQQFQKQVWEGKLTADERSKESTNVDLTNIQKSSSAEVPMMVSDLVDSSTTPASGNNKISENGSSSSSVVGPASEEKVVAANCC